MRACFTFVLMLLALTAVHAEVDDVIVDSDTGFAFAAKFCYDYNPPPADNANELPIGAMRIELNSMVGGGNYPTNLTVLLYDDEVDSWPAIYDVKGMTCAQAVPLAKVAYVVSFDASGKWVLPESSVQIFEHRRPRFWYVVVANTQCQPTTQVSASIHFVNYGSSWSEEFGVNERTLNTMYLLFFFAYLPLVAFHVYHARLLQQTNSYHPLVKVYSFSLGCMGVSIFLYMIHYCTFGSNGVGVLPFQAFAALLDGLARLSFTLLLILLAKGWTITKDEIEGKAWMIGIMGSLVLTHLILLIYDIAGRDEASTLYIYETTPGILICVVSVLSGVWFSITVYFTHMTTFDEEKRNFLKRVGLIFSSWFWMLTFIVILARLLDPWVREKVVQWLYVLFLTGFYGVFAYLFTPERVSQYFKVTMPNVSAASNPLGAQPYENL